MAVGSWSSLSYRKGQLSNDAASPIGLIKEFTASSTDASVPAAEIIPDASGWLAGVDVVFDGTTAPSAVVLKIMTIDGLTLFVSSSLTASGRVEISPLIPIVGGVKLTVTTNTTNSAKAKIILLLFNSGGQ